MCKIKTVLEIIFLKLIKLLEKLNLLLESLPPSLTSVKLLLSVLNNMDKEPSINLVNTPDVLPQPQQDGYLAP
jgi:hypothetical protein